MKKILAIDDDQAVLNYLNIMLLQTGGYEVSTLVNSSKAFHELKTNGLRPSAPGHGHARRQRPGYPEAHQGQRTSTSKPSC